jgi:hypothetical protein
MDIAWAFMLDVVTAAAAEIAILVFIRVDKVLRTDTTRLSP